MKPMMWNEKRYHSLDYYLKNRFGEKVYKIALNGGMTCPNRDGTIGTGGCIFCSSGGSGDFAAPVCSSITEQINLAIAGISKAKHTGQLYIAYFQSFTNTYAPIAYLHSLFIEAISHPSIIGLSIATRPDCLPEDALQLLEELNQIKPVWIELGLQTIHESTAIFIRRGYPLSVFEQAVTKLSHCSIDIIVHIIIGLPGETVKELLETIQYLSHLSAKGIRLQGVKLQLLHVLKDTDLAKLLGTFPILTLEEYIDLVILCLEHLPPDIVIHRITGDGPKRLLLAPLWSSKKKHVMNQIHHTLKERSTWQGKYYQP